VLFAIPGLILATTFVTLPYVARELIPVMEALGSEAADLPIVLLQIADQANMELERRCTSRRSCSR
jgi:ABC-type sulfate transport system permease subunit